MNVRGLEARLERLEEAQERSEVGKHGRTHRLIVRVGEDTASAKARYEAENGITIDRADYVVVREVVRP